MPARTDPTGKSCARTREITSSQLIRLIDETRRREAIVEMLHDGVLHDAPTRQYPAAALELVERTRSNGMLIDVQALEDPDTPAAAQDVAALDPGLPMLASGSEVEEMTATQMYAPVPNSAMPPTAAPAQTITTAARRDRERAARVRALLCLGVLVFLCLGVIVSVGLDTPDDSSYVSLGL